MKRRPQRSSRTDLLFPFLTLCRSGTVWNPPHFRSRASIGLQTPSIEAFTYLNYIGGVDDRRTTQVVAGKSMFTIDLSISYRTTNVGGLSGFRFGLSVENLLNRKPQYFAPAPFSEQLGRASCRERGGKYV